MTTNYERIRNLSVEEMANRFIPLNRKGYLSFNGQIYKKRDEVLKANIEWLQARAEG